MNKKRLISDGARLILSALLTTFAVDFIFKFDGLAPGGLTGLALVVSTVTNIEVSTMVVLISIPMLIASTLVLGKSFGFKTIVLTFLTPLMMKIVPSIWLGESLANIHPLLELLVGAIVGGILIGSAISLALYSDCATGGTDVLALLLKKVFNHIELSRLIFILDGTIIIATSIIHKNIFLGVFSLVSLLIIIQTIKFLYERKNLT